MTEAPLESKEFLALRRSGHRRGASVVLGTTAIKLRDGVASGLVAAGVTPNVLTVVGLLLSCCAAACLLVGAGDAAPWEAGQRLETGARPGTSWWPLIAALFLTVAGLQDALDGAVARLGRLDSRFGAVLDSTVDRFSEFAIYFACAIHFAFIGNVTYVALSIVALANAFSVSYVKARADSVVSGTGLELAPHALGYWQRGERCVFFLVAAYFGHVPAALWLMGTLPALTVLRRLKAARFLSTGSSASPRASGSGLQATSDESRAEARRLEPVGWRRLMLWRHPRGSAGYDLCAAVTLAFLIAAPWRWPFLYGRTDPLHILLDTLI